MATKADVVRIARAAVQHRRNGAQTYTVGRVTLNLTQGGMCARFVRQVHEAALGLSEFAWQYRAPNAFEMERNLRAAGLRTSNPQPGDVACFNTAGTPPGHIGIYLGNGEVAENTSSGSRGDPRAPGTKISTLASMGGAARVSGYYAVLPAAVEEAPVNEPSPWAKADWAEATRLGITDGSAPQGPLTREQGVVMLMRLRRLLE